MSKVFQVLGTTDEVTTCGLCGRDDLKSTVVLAPQDGGDPVFYGSDCGARAAGWTVREIERAARNADAEARRVEAEARAAAAAKDTARWEAWLYERTGVTETFAAIEALGGFVAARAQYREFERWA